MADWKWHQRGFGCSGQPFCRRDKLGRRAIHRFPGEWSDRSLVDQQGQFDTAPARASCGRRNRWNARCWQCRQPSATCPPLTRLEQRRIASIPVECVDPIRGSRIDAIEHPKCSTCKSSRSCWLLGQSDLAIVRVDELSQYSSRSDDFTTSFRFACEAPRVHWRLIGTTPCCLRAVHFLQIDGATRWVC